MNICPSEWLFALVARREGAKVIRAAALIVSITCYDSMFGRTGITGLRWAYTLDALTALGTPTGALASTLATMIGAGYIEVGPQDTFFLALPEVPHEG